MMHKHAYDWVFRFAGPSGNHSWRKLGGPFRPTIYSFFAVVFCLILIGNETKAEGQEPSPPQFTLQEIIDLALSRHPDIDLSQGKIDEKMGEQVFAGSILNPSLGLQSGRGQVLDPAGRTITERYVSLSQPIEWPGARSARQRAAMAGLQAAESELKETRIVLTAHAKQSFYHLLLADQRAELAEKTLRTTKNFGHAVKQRVESGESAPFEAVKVEVEILKAQKDVARAKGLVRAAKASLNTLTSGALGHDFSILGRFQRPILNVDEARLLKQAFDHHPTVKKFETRIDMAKERHNEEKQSIIPNITMNGYYQRDAGREGFVGGITVPLPIWNQRQGQIAKAMAIQHQAEAQLLQVKNELRKGITEQVEISRAASAQINTFEKGLLKQAQEAVRIAQVSFRYGEANLLDVLDAQRVLWYTIFSYAEAQHELSIAVTELERLVGKEL